MKKEKILAKVKEVISKINGISPNEIHPEYLLITELFLDETEVMLVIFEIEEIFGCCISHSEYEEILTVENLVDLISIKI